MSWILDSSHALQVVAFLAEDVLVAGGFDGEIYLFRSQDHDWQLTRAIQGKVSLQLVQQQILLDKSRLIALHCNQYLTVMLSTEQSLRFAAVWSHVCLLQVIYSSPMQPH